jgi:hypothetical protein
MREIAMRDRIVAVDSLLQERERLLEVALVEALQREHAESHEPRPGLGSGLGQRGKTLGEFAGAGAADVVVGPLPEQRRYRRRHIADLVGQNQRSFECSQCRRRLIASVCDQRLTQLQL